MGGVKRFCHTWQFCFASSRRLFRFVSHVGSKPIKIEMTSSVDDMVGMYVPQSMGLKTRVTNTPVEMTLKCGPNRGNGECR